MIDVAVWMKTFLERLSETFGCRVWFVGLQGSYGRGEATETSDIDVVVILNELSVFDIRAYHEMLNTLPHRELICGFLSGRDELLHWDGADLFQFYYDTTPIKGSLDVLLPLIDDVTVDCAIKMGACNIYHGCVHNMLHERSDDILKGLYKSASFVMQAICFKETGTYFTRQKDMLNIVSAEEASVIETFLALKQGGEVDFDQMSEKLFLWSKKYITMP